MRPLRPGIFRAARREASELPPQRPGTVLVFQIQERYVAAPPGRLRLDSELAVDANAVLLVAMEARVVTVIAELPSIGTSAVVLRAMYTCRVMDPALVLDAGCFNAGELLGAHLINDDIMAMLALHRDITSDVGISQRILARIHARNAASPPFLPGLLAELSGVALGIRAGRVDPPSRDQEWVSRSPNGSYAPSGEDQRPTGRPYASTAGVPYPDGIPQSGDSSPLDGYPQDGYPQDGYPPDGFPSDAVGIDGYPRTYADQ
jgi:hypothetical protein